MSKPGIAAGDLPTEMLSRIFLFLSGEKHTWATDCVAVSQVCQRWRMIGHGNRELWTTPPLQRFKWTELVLKLSRRRTLDIIWRIPKDKDKSNLSIAALCLALGKDILPRIRTLVIDDQIQDLDFWLRVHPCLTRWNFAPHLETLCINMPFVSASRALSEHFFMKVPLLRELRLSNFTLALPSTTLQQLRVLALIECDMVKWRTFSEMLHALQGATELEDLSLCGMTLANESWHTAPVTEATFAPLHTLRLAGPAQRVAQMLHALNMPRGAGRELALSYRFVQGPSEPQYTPPQRLVYDMLRNHFAEAFVSGSYFRTVHMDPGKGKLAGLVQADGHEDAMSMDSTDTDDSEGSPTGDDSEGSTNDGSADEGEAAGDRFAWIAGVAGAGAKDRGRDVIKTATNPHYGGEADLPDKLEIIVPSVIVLWPEIRALGWRASLEALLGNPAPSRAWWCLSIFPGDSWDMAVEEAQ